MAVFTFFFVTACRLSLQLESEGVEVITMDHPAVTSLGDLTFDSPFHLPITLHPSGSAEKVFVRVKNPCNLVDRLRVRIVFCVLACLRASLHICVCIWLSAAGFCSLRFGGEAC